MTNAPTLEGSAFSRFMASGWGRLVRVGIGLTIILAGLFAISMDYTVFLLASAREHFERSKDGAEAVRGSIAHTGRPIVAAAGIMIAVFYTFAIAGTLPMKEMGLILGTAVLLDAFVVRLVLVPAVLSIVGNRAWYLPRWADRILPDVRFAH